jgi:hypothetical protein
LLYVLLNFITGSKSIGRETYQMDEGKRWGAKEFQCGNMGDAEACEWYKEGLAQMRTKKCSAATAGSTESTG